jgi:AcrR family transcriptional regulator
MSKPRRHHDPTSAWKPAPGQAAPRERLTRTEIVARAIRLIDDEGLESFSMRRLGHALGAGATSLYWHVRGKDELTDLILDELIGMVMADIDPAIGPEAPWRDQLAEMARALRRVMLRHRNVAPLLGERPTLGPNALAAAEHVIGLLRAAGFPDRSASLASGALINYASGFALFECRSPGGSSDSPESRDMTEAVAAYFASLPPERFPNTRAVAAIDISADEQFEFGLRAVLDGLAADLAAADQPPTAADEPATAPGQQLTGSGDDGGNVLLTR